ncbi:MAG: nitrilase-related carbon-nitrogen hydrolase [Cyclobacteriaceae bacterium]|jgi:predicted amidohydrolase
MKLKNFLFLVFMLAAWAWWSNTNRSPDWTSSDAHLDVYQEIRADTSCSRNIVAIQPYMVPQDYLTEQHFSEKIRLYLKSAQQKGYLKERTVVVLPEYLGTWLVLENEKEWASEVSKLNYAMAILILSNPVDFAKWWMRSKREEDRVAAAIFRMKATRMARSYSRVFKELAKDYKVTINAGSILLPGPTVEGGQIRVDLSESLYNTSFFFMPDGSIYPSAVRKSFPTSDELPFVAAAPINELPVFDLSIGKTAALVCADSWYPESYTKIKELGAEVVLVNSYCSTSGAMSKFWGGYDGAPAPPDVDLSTVGKITEGEAWVRYALPGRLESSGALVGVNVFLRGELWDLGTDGQPFLIRNGERLNVASSSNAGIWSLCW